MRVCGGAFVVPGLRGAKSPTRRAALKAAKPMNTCALERDGTVPPCPDLPVFMGSGLGPAGRPGMTEGCASPTLPGPAP